MSNTAAETPAWWHQQLPLWRQRELAVAGCLGNQVARKRLWQEWLKHGAPPNFAGYSLGPHHGCVADNYVFARCNIVESLFYAGEEYGWGKTSPVVIWLRQATPIEARR